MSLLLPLPVLKFEPLKLENEEHFGDQLRWAASYYAAHYAVPRTILYPIEIESLEERCQRKARNYNGVINGDGKDRDGSGSGSEVGPATPDGEQRAAGG